MAHFPVAVVTPIPSDRSISDALQQFYDHKWDWWGYGERWPSMLLRDGQKAHSAKKADIDVEGTTKETYFFAVLQNGEWHEVYDDWPTTFRSLWDSIPDDHHVTIVDCHI